MRGSPIIYSYGGDESGIIPAHAGLTQRASNMKKDERDHPRACGAHPRRPGPYSSGTGSSPRMRGSHSKMAIDPAALGIIPAHAGLTGLPWKTTARGWDHPRACGAHFARYGMQALS